MDYVYRLFLILALSFGAMIAPDGSSACVSDIGAAQMDVADGMDHSCGSCVPAGYADSLACEGGCPVPCGSGGTVGIATWTPSLLGALMFGSAVLVAEPLIPSGANPSPDPFPPKLSV